MNEPTIPFQKFIPQLKDALYIEPIAKGYSTDKKYRVTVSDGSSLLLKTASIKQWERKQSEYHVLSDLQTYHVKTSIPLDLGMIADHDLCYVLFSYLEGNDAAEELSAYSEDEQYAIGVVAGQELAKMHQHPAPQTIPSWYSRAAQKHQNYVHAYQDCGIRLKHDKKIIDFIESTILLMRSRPNHFQHDDFHVGNLIVKDKEYVGAIDFNRYDWGDPLHDFYKLGLFSREISVPFCIGQIHGYYDQQMIPEHFWKLYSLYMAMSLFSGLAWSIRVTPHLVDGMTDRIYRILEDHKYFEADKPLWYRED